MSNFNNKIGILSGNILKIIAMVLMLIDHVGYILYPNIEILRIIGRLSFPIFAFFVAEGCKYTSNKLRYFLLIFGCAILFQLVTYFSMGETFMGIFVTFSVAIIVTYSLMFFKKTILQPKYKWYHRIISGIIFISTIFSTYFLNVYFEIDYGFYGCLTPAIISIFTFNYIDKKTTYNNKITNILYKLDCLYSHLLALLIALILIWAYSIDISLKSIQLYSLLSIPILLLYTGKRGKYRLKYLFYVFHPTHLVILHLIATYLI